MLTYAETASRSAIVPVASVPSSQYQEHLIDLPTSLPSPASYAIGPLDPAQFTTLQARLATGATCSLLVPLRLRSPCSLTRSSPRATRRAISLQKRRRNGAFPTW